MTVWDSFRLDGKVVVITGGAGLLGRRHAAAALEAGGIPVIWDLDQEKAQSAAEEISRNFGGAVHGQAVDITSEEKVSDGCKALLSRFGRVDVLINNAANDPKVGQTERGPSWTRLEHFPLDVWNADLDVGLKGAFLCSRSLGGYMAQNQGGVILNVASDLGLIAPDQRIYRIEGLEEAEQPVKPVTYSVVKHALIGLTKYLATYWAEKNVRVNSISPGGVFVNQSEEFLSRLTKLIPLGRMAREDEYMAAVLFLISDASSYMTGANLSIDGGRTCW